MSVDEVIKKGYYTINLPIILFYIVVIVFSIYFSIENVLPYWSIPIAIILAILFSWLYWSLTITNWRIYSMRNVDNVHEWKKRAIEEHLIWNDGNIFNKTEIKSKYQKELLKELNKKFLLPEKKVFFKDDYEVPPETIIRYSKGTNLIEMGGMLICLGLGLYIITATENQLIGILLTFFGVYFAQKEYKQAFNKKPQITINDKGISLIISSYKWSEIANERLKTQKGYRSLNHYLWFNIISSKHEEYELNYKEVQIDDFDISAHRLEYILKIYRNRYDKVKIKNA